MCSNPLDREAGDKTVDVELLQYFSPKAVEAIQSYLQNLHHYPPSMKLQSLESLPEGLKICYVYSKEHYKSCTIIHYPFLPHQKVFVVEAIMSLDADASCISGDLDISHQMQSGNNRDIIDPLNREFGVDFWQKYPPEMITQKVSSSRVAAFAIAKGLHDIDLMKRIIPNHPELYWETMLDSENWDWYVPRSGEDETCKLRTLLEKLPDNLQSDPRHAQLSILVSMIEGNWIEDIPKLSGMIHERQIDDDHACRFIHYLLHNSRTSSERHRKLILALQHVPQCGVWEDIIQIIVSRRDEDLLVVDLESAGTDIDTGIAKRVMEQVNGAVFLRGWNHGKYFMAESPFPDERPVNRDVVEQLVSKTPPITTSGATASTDPLIEYLLRDVERRMENTRIRPSYRAREHTRARVAIMQYLAPKAAQTYWALSRFAVQFMDANAAANILDAVPAGLKVHPRHALDRTLYEMQFGDPDKAMAMQGNLKPAPCAWSWRKDERYNTCRPGFDSIHRHILRGKYKQAAGLLAALYQQMSEDCSAPHFVKMMIDLQQSGELQTAIKTRLKHAPTNTGLQALLWWIHFYSNDLHNHPQLQKRISAATQGRDISSALHHIKQELIVQQILTAYEDQKFEQCLDLINEHEGYLTRYHHSFSPKNFPSLEVYKAACLHFLHDGIGARWEIQRITGIKTGIHEISGYYVDAMLRNKSNPARAINSLTHYIGEAKKASLNKPHVLMVPADVAQKQLKKLKQGRAIKEWEPVDPKRALTCFLTSKTGNPFETMQGEAMARFALGQKKKALRLIGDIFHSGDSSHYRSWRMTDELYRLIHIFKPDTETLQKLRDYKTTDEGAGYNNALTTVISWRKGNYSQCATTTMPHYNALCNHFAGNQKNAAKTLLGMHDAWRPQRDYYYTAAVLNYPFDPAQSAAYLKKYISSPRDDRYDLISTAEAQRYIEKIEQGISIPEWIPPDSAGYNRQKNPYSRSAMFKLRSLVGIKIAVVSLKPDAPKENGVNDSTILEIVQKHANQLKHCHQKELNRVPNLYGSVFIEFTISKTGRVSRETIAHSTLRNASIEDCFVRVIEHLSFPKPKMGKDVTVKLEVAFTPKK